MEGRSDWGRYGFGTFRRRDVLTMGRLDCKASLIGVIDIRPTIVVVFVSYFIVIVILLEIFRVVIGSVCHAINTEDRCRYLWYRA